MKKLLKVLIISLILLSLSGCAGVQDYNITLPNDYSVVRGSAHMITINKQRPEGGWGEDLIPAKVVEVTWDDKYILAKQLSLQCQDSDNPDNSYHIPDETKVNYWILEMETGKKFGPFNEKKFTKKKKELNKKNVILKSVDDYEKNY